LGPDPTASTSSSRQGKGALEPPGRALDAFPAGSNPPPRPRVIGTLRVRVARGPGC